MEQYTGDFEEEFEDEEEVNPSETLKGNELLTVGTPLLESSLIDPLTSTSEANDSASVEIETSVEDEEEKSI